MKKQEETFELLNVYLMTTLKEKKMTIINVNNFNKKLKYINEHLMPKRINNKNIGYNNIQSVELIQKYKSMLEETVGFPIKFKFFPAEDVSSTDCIKILKDESEDYLI